MLARLKRKRSEEGFTLIELLIVIIILAILAVIVIFAVGSTTKNASIAACKTTVKTVQTAVAAYDTSVGTYPTALATLLVTSVAAQTGGTAGPFLKNLPATGAALPSGKNYAFTTAVGATGTIYIFAKNHVTSAAATTGTACTAA